MKVLQIALTSVDPLVEAQQIFAAEFLSFCVFSPHK